MAKVVTASSRRKQLQSAQEACPARKTSWVSSMVLTESNISEEGLSASCTIHHVLPQHIAINAKCMAKATASSRRKWLQPAQEAYPARKTSQVSSMVLTDSNLSEEGLSALPICPGLLQSIAINAKQVGNAAIGHYYLKLTKQQIDASGTVLDEDLGLVRLE